MKNSVDQFIEGIVVIQKKMFCSPIILIKLKRIY